MRRVKIALLLPLLVGGCDSVEAWLSKIFATNKRVDAIEKTLNENNTSTTQRLMALEAATAGKQKVSEDLSYDDCVLEHIRDATSDVAALSIKQSCMNKVSVPVDISHFQNSDAVYGKIFAGSQDKGLGVHLYNESPYTLTSIAFDIQEKKTGKHHYYWINWFGEPNVLYGVMKDDTSLRMLPPGEHYVGFLVNEIPSDEKKFFMEYTWNILTARGFIH